MTENSRFWDGTTIGDATEAPYNAPDEFAAVLRSINGANANPSRSGVCRGELNTLTCTGAASPISVNTGRAFVHGSWYESDAAVSFNIGNPGPNSRIDTLVLRKTWSTQQVRLAVVTGEARATPVAPALIQDATVAKIWEFPLYNIYVSSLGVITLVDRREYVPYLSTQMFEKISELTLVAPDDIVTFVVSSGLSYKTYILVSNVKCDNLGSDAGVRMVAYFTPNDITKYTSQLISAVDLAVGAASQASGWAMDIGVCATDTFVNTNNWSSMVTFFMNLHDATKRKNVLGLGYNDPTSFGGQRVEVYGGHYNYTADITSINLAIRSGENFKIGSNFTLYGMI